MNRPVAISPEGRVMLRPGRAYRLLVVVNGATSLQDVAEAFFDAGFAAEGFAASAPDNWPDEAPADWPDEPPIEHAANECLVRISGHFSAPGAAAFEPDQPIGNEGACYSIAAAWEPRRDRRSAATGAAAPAAPAAPEPQRTNTGGLLVAAGALVGFGIWQHIRQEKRIEREQTRMRRVLEQTARENTDEQVRALVAEGHSRADAERLAGEMLSAEASSPELLALLAMQEAMPPSRGSEPAALPPPATDAERL